MSTHLHDVSNDNPYLVLPNLARYSGENLCE